MGLVWSSRAQPPGRTINPALLLPLARVAGVRLINLQKPPETSPEVALPGELGAINVAPELHDFAETAALVESLDLLVTVDTAAAHVCGALGKPGWVLLKHPPAGAGRLGVGHPWGGGCA